MEEKIMDYIISNEVQSYLLENNTQKGEAQLERLNMYKRKVKEAEEDGNQL